MKNIYRKILSVVSGYFASIWSFFININWLFDSLLLMIFFIWYYWIFDLFLNKLINRYRNYQLKSLFSICYRCKNYHVGSLNKKGYIDCENEMKCKNGNKINEILFTSMGELLK